LTLKKIKRTMGTGFALAASLLSRTDYPVPPPGSRVVTDAHNCYPYNHRWADRIERALSIGLPVAIEQDLFWYSDPRSGRSWSVLSHGDPVEGTEPLMRDYFFERIRPMMEQALRDGNKGDWPLITLNLDFKSDEAAHHAAIWKLLGDYESWLCTAERSADPSQVMPLRAGPLLVLTGEADSQQRDFHDLVPVGARLRAFGAVHTVEADPSIAADEVIMGRATNYRRWWNNPWKVVEKGGQRQAGEWTERDAQRLQALVAYAHRQNLWIRFYTLNGHPQELLAKNGWDLDYDFGSREAVESRWRAALLAGVDYLATDQYEDLAAFRRSVDRATSKQSRRIPFPAEVRRGSQ
jgi:hypothetical protein